MRLKHACVCDMIVAKKKNKQMGVTSVGDGGSAAVEPDMNQIARSSQDTNSSFTIVDLVADRNQLLVVGLRLPGTYRISSGRDCALSGDQRIPCCNRSS